MDQLWKPNSSSIGPLVYPHIFTLQVSPHILGDAISNPDLICECFMTLTFVK